MRNAREVLVPLLILACLALPRGASAAAPSRETPIVAAVRKASPAVVNISTETVTRSPFRGFFEEFFGDLGRDRKERGQGSGVVVRPDGTILTNEHVIANASRIVVTLATGEEYEARLVGADSRTDLAVLKVDAKGELPFATLGSSADLMIGETVIAIGNPFGLSHTVTTGVVSALNRSIRGEAERAGTDFIQTDASINPGNSGGPLLNILGEVVGINTAIFRPAEGIGFAIPADRAKRIIESLLTYGKVRRAWIGARVQELTTDLARHFGASGRGGVLVNRVFPESPAEEVGLRSGDVLLSLGGQPLRDPGDYLGALAGYTLGSRISIRRLRNGAESEVLVQPREPGEEYVQRLAESWMGVRVEPNSKEVATAKRLVTERGQVVTQVRPGSAAAKAGVAAGDVVRRVNDTTVDSAEEYREAVLGASQVDTVVLVVQRGRTAYYLTLNP